MESSGDNYDRESEEMDREGEEEENDTSIILRDNRAERRAGNNEGKESISELPVHQQIYEDDSLPKTKPPIASRERRARVTRLAAQFADVESDDLLPIAQSDTRFPERGDREITEASACKGQSERNFQPVNYSDVKAHEPNGTTNSGSGRGQGSKRGRGRKRKRHSRGGNRRGGSGNNVQQYRTHKTPPNTENTQIRGRFQSHEFQSDSKQEKPDFKRYESKASEGCHTTRTTQHKTLVQEERQQLQGKGSQTRFEDYKKCVGSGSEQEEFYDAEDNDDQEKVWECSKNNTIRENNRSHNERGNMSFVQPNRQDNSYSQSESRCYTQGRRSESTHGSRLDTPLHQKSEVHGQYLQRSRTLPSKGIEAQGYNPEVETVSAKIEVYGFDSSTDEDVLTMYFEDTRKSGGGDIEHIDIDSAKRSATITFQDSSVTGRILKRNHILAGSTLTVTEKKEMEPGKYESNDTEQEEPERVIEVSGFKSKTSKDTLAMYFESVRRSGGGEVTDVQMDVAKNKATVKFVDQSVIDRVLERKHTLEGATLIVIEKKMGADENESNETEEERERVVEVSGFKSNTSEDTLTMYFESTRRSGGGEVTDVQMDVTKKKATVKFADHSVIDRVLKKTHTLEGASLTVVERKAQPDRPIDLHRIFLQGLPEDIQEETLMLFLENRTNIPEDPDIVYGEHPGTAMLYYAQEIQDLDKVINKFREKPLKGKTLTAERVKITECILVQEIASNTSKDMLELYFENHRKSGGGPVTDVEFHGDENRAVVFFEDWSTVTKVTERSHTLLGKTITVTAHYECLGTSISTEGPVPTIPKPTKHTVDPVIMEYIFTRHSSSLVEEMKKYNTEAIWPENEDKSRVVLKPIPIEGDDHAIWRKWKATTAKQFSNFLQQFITESIEVPSNIWADLSELLSNVEVGDVEIHQKGDKSSVTLMGIVADVQAVKEKVLEHIKNLKIKAERESQTIERKLKLSPLKIKLFSGFSVSAELNENFPDVQVNVVADTNEIIFKGIRGEISEAQVTMYSIFESLKSCIFNTDQNTFDFIKQFCHVINEMLSSKGLDSLCDVDECKIIVYGKKLADAKNSMQVLKTEVISNTMSIRGESTMAVLQSEKGSDKINAINDNEDEVIMRVDSSKRIVHVSGFKDKVETAIAELGQFLEENAIVEKVVNVRPLQSRYIRSFCGKELSEIQSQKPAVNFEYCKNGFIIKGNEQGVDDVTGMLEKITSKLVERQHQVDKPGIPRVLRGQKGQRTLTTIARSCECVIDTENDLKFDESKGASDHPASSISEVLCHFTTAEGCRLLVCKGDLTKENVDAIVNAANTDLQHIGGLAKAIVKAGGETIQQESDHIRKQLGRKLATSEAVCTGAGRLPCRHVIHVPGPMWPKHRRRDKRSTSHEEDLLYDAVTNALQEAHVRKLKSVALPAISSGVYGFPLDLCAKITVEASVEFIKKNPSGLREIRFTNVTVEHSLAFQSALKSVCGQDVVDGLPASATSKGPARRASIDSASKPASKDKISTPVPKPQTLFDKQTPDTIATKEGIKIILKKGSIATDQADVLVNTTAGEMKLTRGNVSNALLQAAGPGLQQECDVQVTQSDGTRKDVVAGDFIETGPANLKCKKIYHSHCPGYNQTDAVKILNAMIEKLLLQASKSGMTSIAIPAIGTGNLNFPRDVVARAMYEGVAKFSKDNPSTSLKDIRFWVYDKDQPTIQAFETEIQRLATPLPQTASAVPQAGKKSKRKMKKSASAISFSVEEPPTVDIPEETLPEAVFSAHGGSSEIKLDSVSVQLQQGNLVKENTDAIVNTVGKDLALKGVVARALIKAGGNDIADECDKIRNASKSIPRVVKTTAGNLPSKYIIHVALSGPERVKKMTTEILQLAEKEGLQSIAFPALGTGNLGGSAHGVAPELIDAIGEFAINEKPKALQLIKLVIFQQNMIPVFEETMKKKAAASFKKPEGALTRGLKAAWKYATGGSEHLEGTAKRHGHDRRTDATVDKEKQDSIILYIVAGEDSRLDEAVKQIEDFIKDEFHSEELVPDGEVVEVTDAVLREIKSIAQKHQVKVATKPGNKGVMLEGTKVSVFSTKADIQTLFARIQAEEKRKAKDLLLSKEVQWRYKTDAGIYDDYDEDVNGIIERAHQEKKPFIDLNMEEGKIRIDFVNMKEIDLTGSNPDMELHRADLEAETSSRSSSVPDNWIPMAEGTNLTVVALVQGSTEYKQVEQTFRSGGYTQGTIVKIERIQNKELYTQYTARKESMRARLGRETERTLYHGTSKDTVDKINLRGFNRSFCGKNAVAYGQGTYFARDVQYSAQSTYSPPDANNQKHIYMCKVLVGDAEPGDSSIIVPRQKPGSPDIYDSTVNNVQNPSIVVIYHDAQAYPEYLVTFT